MAMDAILGVILVTIHLSVLVRRVIAKLGKANLEGLSTTFGSQKCFEGLFAYGTLSSGLLDHLKGCRDEPRVCCVVTWGGLA